MTVHSPATWVAEFLNQRELNSPDGRALYAYRCTTDEFDSLAEALSNGTLGGTSTAATRAFVLYAAEWWQRKYDGGHWAWEPLLESINWKSVHYPDLYQPVREALRWWKLEPVRLPTSVRYLGTFACQGGLPLALVGNPDSRVTQYLRAVLKHTAAYRQFVDDPIELARDQQHLLRPPTLRRDYVFRLAADLTEAVLNLRDDLQDEDPLGTLDRTRPDWHSSMPLDLGDARARDLLTGLLRDAARDRAASVNDFRVERFLRRTAVGWRLGARVSLPGAISASDLALHLRVSATDLPSRLEVRVQGDRVCVVGLYAARSDEFLLMSRHAQSQAEMWDADAAAEIRLQFLAGDVIGEGVVPYRGGALGELPWAFRSDDVECPFIGEGSVSNRAPETMVLVPKGCRAEALEETQRLDDSVLEDVCVLERLLWRITEPTTISTANGSCVIKPGSAQAVEEDYLLTGQRLHDFESAWPLFRGTPKLRVAKAGQWPRAVPSSEVSWRQTGRDWQPYPTGFGLWQVRHMHGGELRHLSRTGILPEQFDVHLVPQQDMSEGLVELSNAEDVKVLGRDEKMDIEVQVEGNPVRVHVRARDAAVAPAKVHLRLHWQGAEELAVFVPFPGRGGRFLRDGRPVDGSLVVDDLYGVRAVAMAAGGSKRFWIEGDLKAPDLEYGLLTVAYFRVPLRWSGMTHEMPLVDARGAIELLMGASSYSDTRVVLRIVDEFQNQYGALQIHRFVGAVEYDASTAFVKAPQTLSGQTAVTFEALPISRPDVDPVRLDVLDLAETPHVAKLPEDVTLDEPWLVVARQHDRLHVQPVVVGGLPSDPSTMVLDDVPYLHEALRLNDQHSRIQATAAAMDAMLDTDDARRADKEWLFLTNSLLRAEGLPATELDLLRVLVTKPRLLVRCLFRLESAPRRQLWRLEDDLQFSWLLIRRDVWWTEAQRVFNRLRGQIDDDQVAREHVMSILREGTERGLRAVAVDIEFRLRGGRIPAPIIEDARKKRDDKIQEQLTLRSGTNDWPRGYGRNEWTEELVQGHLLNQQAIWQREDEPRERQPIFDTPVAAAWCCFHSQPTEPTTFLVKRIRAHDREWFDSAYEAAWFRLAVEQDGADT